MPTNFITWNMQGSGSGANRILKWEQLLDYLNDNAEVDYVAIQEAGQRSTYDTLRHEGYASDIELIDQKIYNRNRSPEIMWQFDYFEVSNDADANNYGVYFLSRYTKEPHEANWTETLRVSLGIIVRLPQVVTKWMFVKFGDDISDLLRPPVGVVIDSDFMIASLHSSAAHGFNTATLVNDVCDWMIGENIDELYVLGDFNINDLLQGTVDRWLAEKPNLDSVLQTVPPGGVGAAEQYTQFGTGRQKRRLDYGLYIYDKKGVDPGDFNFQTIFYDFDQPMPPINQPVPNPIGPGNHDYEFKSDHRPLLFEYT